MCSGFSRGHRRLLLQQGIRIAELAHRTIRTIVVSAAFIDMPLFDAAGMTKGQFRTFQDFDAKRRAPPFRYCGQSRQRCSIPPGIRAADVWAAAAAGGYQCSSLVIAGSACQITLSSLRS